MESNSDLHFYVDESGNTGSNLLNESQPFFVFGGWLMNEKYENKLRNIVDYFEFESKELHYKKQSIGLALKSLEIMNKMINDSMETLINLDSEEFILPVIIETRKEDILIEKFMYTVFDSYYSDRKYKENIDRLIYDSDAKVKLLDEIKVGFKSDKSIMSDVEGLYKYREEDVEEAMKMLDHCISKLLKITEGYEGFLKDIDKHAVLDDFSVKDKFQYASETSTNTIGALLDSLEKISNASNRNYKITIYPDSDESKIYIDDYWDELNEVSFGRESENVNMYKNIFKMYTKLNSSEYLGIQLSDVLCSTRNEYMRIKDGMYTSRFKKNIKNEKRKRQQKEFFKNLQSCYYAVLCINKISMQLYEIPTVICF
ncbi:DUF3800 domain-containing protein [Companilactobacillus zhachilii]|uniref:DUF3800 domain-containing protein n=1 Tax=Companilactobacillus zhachilii TaxID=2304606 RepID=UPI00192201E6|nr:DUF3800 domain-containing protein [Companilactobacillus zhachilii]MBL3531793.1 DUF3800 domain-containing protein [Companilactobacillus zhachilii]